MPLSLKIGLPLGGLLLLAAAYFYFVYAPLPAVPALSARVRQTTIRVGERTRSYLAYLPANLRPGAPVLLVLHGSNLDGARMRAWTGYEFDQLADQHGFAVLYPDGYRGNWNDCRRDAAFAAERDNVDDLGFLRALLAQLHAEAGTDPARVYAFDYSNGGQMAFRVGLEAPDLVAGLAAVGANLPTPGTLTCPLAGPTPPVLLVAGTADPISPYAGGRVTLFGFGYRSMAQSALATAEAFAHHNGLTAPPAVSTLPHRVPSDPTRVERRTWSRAGRPFVELYTMQHGGPVVPQPAFRFPRLMNRTTGDLDARASASVSFFWTAALGGTAL